MVLVDTNRLVSSANNIIFAPVGRSRKIIYIEEKQEWIDICVLHSDAEITNKPGMDSASFIFGLIL